MVFYAIIKKLIAGKISQSLGFWLLNFYNQHSDLLHLDTFLQGDIEYKKGAIGFPYTLLSRFWTAEELVSV